MISSLPPAMETTGRSAHINVTRPKIVRWYNVAMGGTDSFDERLSYYCNGVSSTRWPHRIRFSLWSVINAHIIYKTQHELEQHDDKHDLLTFSAMSLLFQANGRRRWRRQLPQWRTG